MCRLTPARTRAESGGLVQPNVGGLSTWDAPSRISADKTLWKYPSNAPVPNGINIVNDEPNHWSWQATAAVTPEKYKTDLASTREWWENLGKVK